MTIFDISDNTIDLVKKKRLFVIILTCLFSLIVWGSLLFFVLKNVKIFFISFSISVIMIAIALLFSLKYSIKLLIKKLKNVQYIIEDERVFIKQDNFENFNFCINEIQYINRYKNDEVIIILNSNKKIIVNKYLKNYDQLIEMLNTFSKVNEISKNTKLDMVNVNLTKLIVGIILFTLIIFMIIINKTFGISVPNSGIDEHDPMIILVEILPIIIFSAILVFIGTKINKRIKTENKKYIIVLFFFTQIILFIMLLIELYKLVFAVGLFMTIFMLFGILLEIFVIYSSIVSSNNIK